MRTALEKEEKPAELIEVLLRLSDPEEAYRVFRKTYATEMPAASGPMARDILQALIKVKVWISALALCKEILQQTNLEDSFRISNATYLIRAAVTAETDAPNSFHGVPQMRAFMEDNALSDENILTALGVEEAGAAFEHFTRDVYALGFYERHFRNPNESIAEHARDRWIVCKRRHINNTRERDKRAREEVRLAEHLRTWRKPVDINLSNYPDLGHLTKVTLRHLPAGVKRDDLQEGDMRLAVKNVEIRIERRKRCLRITDHDTDLVTRIDLVKKELFVSGQSQLKADSQEMSFDSGDNLFAGTILWTGNRAAIKMHLSGLHDPLEIDMPL